MLHRSFKPAKCKTALKLAASRMKLLKNKKEAQLKQLKRELAQLLQSGQDRTAMIRVEHVVREEKTLSAYELIEIYCELIVARLPIIESQKNCPIDLKEAIASVVFASPRCADIPELMDVKKQFAAKYGKEFVSAAAELRPDCGVGRMVIEKLSVKAPDGPTKIKILKSIAEENDIKWDPSAENDPKPPEDLLNGPSPFENVQVRSDYDGKGQSSFQVPSSHGEKPDIHGNLYDHNRSSAQYTRSNAPADIATEARPHGNGNEVRHSYYGNGGDSSSGRQNWNMEFKDAAEAAQAAAESADRASMAARAAAELSGHVNVTGLNSPQGHGRYSNPNFEDQHFAEDQVPKVQSEQINETELDHRSTGKSNQPSPSISRASSLDDDHHMVNSSHMGQMSFDKPSSEAGFESENEEQHDMKSENIDYPVEVHTGKQLSRSSSSHSRTYSYDHDGGSENPFVEGNFDDGPLVFDESGSDEEEEVVLDTHLSENINAWSPRQNVSDPVFTESSSIAPPSDNLLSVTFDDYNGPNYESEEELEKSRHVRTMEVTTSTLSHSFSNDSDSLQVHSSDDHLEIAGEVKDNSNPSQVSDTITDIELNEESSFENGSELNLGKLTGGLRNKGYRLPPYNRNASGNARSSSSPSIKNTDGSEASWQVSHNQSSRTEANEKPRPRTAHAHLGYDSEEKTLQQELNNNDTGIAGNQTSNSGSDESDSGENLPKRTAISKPGIGTGVSRRTKATVLSEKQVATTDHDAESIETSMEHHFETKSSFHMGDLDWARKVAEPESRPIQDSNRPSQKERNAQEPVSKPIQGSNRPLLKETKVVEAVSKPFPESKRPSGEVSLKSAAKEEPNNSLPKRVLSGTSGSVKTSSFESQAKEQPSHVHPNLPDIDALTARLQSLRNDRR